MMHFRSVCGHFVNVAPVQGDGKKWQIRGEDKWQVCVQGPQITRLINQIDQSIRSGVKTLYSDPSTAAALGEAAQLLQISPSSFEETSGEGGPHARFRKASMKRKEPMPAVEAASEHAPVALPAGWERGTIASGQEFFFTTSDPGESFGPHVPMRPVRTALNRLRM